MLFCRCWGSRVAFATGYYFRGIAKGYYFRQLGFKPGL